MSAEVRWIATAATIPLMVGLLVSAWHGYRSAGLRLMLDALPLCG